MNQQDRIILFATVSAIILLIIAASRGTSTIAMAASAVDNASNNDLTGNALISGNAPAYAYPMPLAIMMPRVTPESGNPSVLRGDCGGYCSG